VSIDGRALLGTLNVNPTFVEHIIAFQATASSMPLVFTNLDQAGGGLATAFLDQISICAVHPSCVIIPNGNFEADPTADGNAFETKTPSSWSRNAAGGNTHVAMNGNGKHAHTRGQQHDD